MEDFEKIKTDINEDICDIENDFYGRKLAVGTSLGNIILFENINGTSSKVWELQSHIGPILKLSWSHPYLGPVLASGGFDKKINLFKNDQYNILEKIYEYEIHENIVESLKFSPSPNNLLLISGDKSGNIISCEYSDRIKDFITKKVFAHDFGVNSIDFLDEKNFVTCGNDNIIKIWNYSQENGNVILKNDIILKDNNIITKDLSCKDNRHFVCCGSSDNEGVVNYYLLNEENKWEIKEIYRQNEKIEKIRYNEEKTCIATIDENGKENLIMENELKL